MTRKRQKLRGSVKKAIRSADPTEPEKAQIAVDGADHLYRELRVPNKLVDDDGNHVKLVEGEQVEVKIESEDPGAQSSRP